MYGSNVMESAVYIDDTLLQDLGARVRLSSQEPMLPAIRNQTITVPGRHGAYDFGGWLEPREITLNCVFERRENYSELKRSIQQLNTLLLDEWGRPRTVRLRFGDAMDRYYNARLVSAVDIERVARLGVFSLPFIAFDPHAYFLYSSTNIILDSDIPVLSDITLGAQYEFNLNPTPTKSEVCEIINDGTASVRPKILISGTADSIDFWNTRNNNAFFINNVKDMIEIDGENYTVKVNGVNKLSILNGDFIELLPGVNSIVIGAEKHSNLNVSFDFTFKYL